jgi:hypothetical protein
VKVKRVLYELLTSVRLQYQIVVLESSKKPPQTKPFSPSSAFKNANRKFESRIDLRSILLEEKEARPNSPTPIPQRFESRSESSNKVVMEEELENQKLEQQKTVDWTLSSTDRTKFEKEFDAIYSPTFSCTFFTCDFTQLILFIFR